MNSLRILTLAATTVSLALLPCGCRRSHSEGSSAVAEHSTNYEREEGVSFKAGKGLQVSTETSKFIGLRTEDVGEKQVVSTFRFDTQVYRTSGTALASGQVNRSDAAALHNGQQVTLTTAGGDSFSGRITEVNSTLGTNANRVEVILAIEDAKAPLRSGAFLSATVPTGSEKAVVAVPKGALLRTAEGNFVYTVSGDRFVRTAVKLGVANHELTEITDGLYAGDQIVVQPVMTLWMAELQSIRGGQACADGH